jgi:PadR family transcriptional regulator, regulatory protein PadR
MDPNLLKGNLELILLSILEEGEKYGLEITKEANARTDGYFRLNVGSLYPALHKLERSKLLTVDTRENPRGGVPVRYYRLTDEGIRALADKRKSYDVFDGAMRTLWGKS